MRRTALIGAVLYLIAGSAFGADDGGRANLDQAEARHATTCALIEAAAAEHGLPLDFFTRLIWQESRFRASAISPKGAQGIAQFMPGTAEERGLEDPFDPRQAIPASAALLKDLRSRFGNLGLAAAAYNAGADRVSTWLSGSGMLPVETLDYVSNITGRSADDWADNGRAKPDPANRDTMSCLQYAALADRPDSGFDAVQSAPLTLWGVQVAGNFSQARALGSYRRLQQRYPSILGDIAPLVLRKRNLSRGTRRMTYIRVPAQTRQAAGEICRKLQSRGGSCIVLRN